MKILLISGHGAGDSGAVGCGHKEADLTRTATNILAGKLAAYDVSVTRYPVARDAYQDNRNGSLAVHLDGFGLVVEVHFNSYNGSAYGTEVLYKPSGMKALASKVSSAIASCGFYDRGAKQRTNLANMNRCARLGVPYILIETCFIDNSADMKVYKDNLYMVWEKAVSAICGYYGIKKLASNGGDAAGSWKQAGSNWYYYKNGALVKSKWVQYKDAWYYLNADGKMATTQWAQDSNGYWYWLDSTGKMAANRWLQAKNDWYWLEKDGKMAFSKWKQWKSYWYWLDANGRMAKNHWLQYNGDWYWLKADGTMATSPQTIKGKTYNFGQDGKWIK